MSQNKSVFTKLLGASSHDQINMTEFWLEFDRKFFTTTNVTNWTWPKNIFKIWSCSPNFGHIHSFMLIWSCKYNYYILKTIKSKLPRKSLYKVNVTVLHVQLYINIRLIRFIFKATKHTANWQLSMRFSPIS